MYIGEFKYSTEKKNQSLNGISAIQYKAYTERLLNFLNLKNERSEGRIIQVNEFAISISNIRENLSVDFISKLIDKNELDLNKYKCLEFFQKTGENKNKYIDIVKDFQ